MIEPNCERFSDSAFRLCVLEFACFPSFRTRASDSAMESSSKRKQILKIKCQSRKMLSFLVYVVYDVSAAIAASHNARANAVSPARTSTLTFFFSDDLTRTKTTSLQTRCTCATSAHKSRPIPGLPLNMHTACCNTVLHQHNMSQQHEMLQQCRHAHPVAPSSTPVRNANPLHSNPTLPGPQCVRTRHRIPKARTSANPCTVPAGFHATRSGLARARLCGTCHIASCF